MYPIYLLVANLARFCRTWIAWRWRKVFAYSYDSFPDQFLHAHHTSVSLDLLVVSDGIIWTFTPPPLPLVNIVALCLLLYRWSSAMASFQYLLLFLLFILWRGLLISLVVSDGTYWSLLGGGMLIYWSR